MTLTTVLLAVGLSTPVLRSFLAGDLDVGATALRVGAAAIVARLAVALLDQLAAGYRTAAASSSAPRRRREDAEPAPADA